MIKGGMKNVSKATVISLVIPNLASYNLRLCCYWAIQTNRIIETQRFLRKRIHHENFK